jgi:hypothetical protein
MTAVIRNLMRNFQNSVNGLPARVDTRVTFNTMQNASNMCANLHNLTLISGFRRDVNPLKTKHICFI